MASFTIMGKAFSTNGELPAVGDSAPDFKLTNSRLKDKSLADFKGKKKILYTVSSLDTDVCEKTTEEFSRTFGEHENVVFLVISGDLPFAQERVIKQLKLKNITALSEMRNRKFAKDYGLLVQDGPLAGLIARAVIIINEDDNVIYTEFVEELTNAPDYEKALAALK